MGEACRSRELLFIVALRADVSGAFFIFVVMNLHLQLIAQTDNSTLSILSHSGDFLCFVLEDGYREKKVPGHTRIAPGRYRLAKRTHGGFYERHKRKWGHEFAIEILDVPEFSDVLIHPGNITDDTRGCLLVGLKAVFGAFPDPEFCLENSVAAYEDLYRLIAAAFDSGQDVWLRVSRAIEAGTV